jgi:hypothetical protein
MLKIKKVAMLTVAAVTLGAAVAGGAKASAATDYPHPWAQDRWDHSVTWTNVSSSYKNWVMSGKADIVKNNKIQTGGWKGAGKTSSISVGHYPWESTSTPEPWWEYE